MLCQNCKQNNATTHIHTVVNGVVTDKYLCSACAEIHNKNSFDSNDFLKLLSSFFGTETTHYGSTSVVKCDRCGMSFDEVRNSGRLGCAECYKAFGKQLEPTVMRLHGSLQHVGKRPNDCNKATEETVSRSEITALKQRLQEAILEEDFELAAVLRDQIKAREE